VIKAVFPSSLLARRVELMVFVLEFVVFDVGLLLPFAASLIYHETSSGENRYWAFISPSPTHSRN